jgi:hypothetical protein
MDQVQKRLDEIKQKQLQMQESIQAARSKASSRNKSHLVTALMGDRRRCNNCRHSLADKLATANEGCRDQCVGFTLHHTWKREQQDG